jgi:hypothetical protein
MKARLMERIQKRFGELSDAGCALNGDRLRRVRNLPLLHLVKLSDALDGATVGASRGDSWPLSIVEAILVASDD